MIKNLTDANDWVVYHKSLGATKSIELNNSSSSQNYNVINSTAPTASVFSLGTHGYANANNKNYLAYVFAGGESTAATARSVDFDGTGDYLVTNSSSDYDLGTGDFTCELWFMHRDNSNDDIVDRRSTNNNDFDINVNNNQINIVAGGTSQFNSRAMPQNQWYHIALVRHSATTTLYLNGIPEGSFSDTNDYNNTDILIGTYMNPPSYELNGKMSNLRLVKGTAVYTSAFRPPTEPLTNISGTVLLCCNNSSVTGTTVGTVTSGGNPTASTDSPFDDPAGFVFGENEDQGIIKCGSFVGNDSNDGPEINLGWEPQWVLLKNIDSSESWQLVDSIRGVTTGGNDAILNPDSTSSEAGGYERIDITATGFKITTTYTEFNGDGDTIVYMAIRRPDGYVGKPAEVGTDVFTPTYDTSGAPLFVTPHIVDFAISNDYGVTSDFNVSARLIQGKRLETNTSNVEETNNYQVGDYNNGWGSYASGDGSRIGWQWKRHKGFDVLAYKGLGVTGQQVPHGLNAVPEMMWVKRRNGAARDWNVYHKALNGGTNPEGYKLLLNTDVAEASTTTAFASTAPTSTHISLGHSSDVNLADTNYLAILFASVPGISKVGSFAGSSSDVTLDLGFVPRFIMVKARSGPQVTNWVVWDSVRGITSGSPTPRIYFNTNNAQTTTNDNVATTSSGITIETGPYFNNASGYQYIYYAHA